MKLLLPISFLLFGIALTEAGILQYVLLWIMDFLLRVTR